MFHLIERTLTEKKGSPMQDFKTVVCKKILTTITTSYVGLLMTFHSTVSSNQLPPYPLVFNVSLAHNLNTGCVVHDEKQKSLLHSLIQKIILHIKQNWNGIEVAKFIVSLNIFIIIEFEI